MTQIKKKIINHKVSLKQKWALATGIGVLVIVSLFTVLLFYRFSEVLLDQERTQVENTLTAVSTRINSNKYLNRPSVEGALSFQDEHSRKTRDWYFDSLATNLVRNDVTVEVYDLNSKQLFASRKTRQVPFKKVSKRKIIVKKIDNQIALLGRQPLKNEHGKLVGYVQVIDRMDSYHTSIRQVASLTAALIILAVLIAA